MDALVSQGLLMDSFYVFQICSPTRSALVSGRYPFHVSQALPEGFHAISRQYELLPALLKRSGNYRTYHVGKWRESNAPAHALARNHVCLVSAHHDQLTYDHQSNHCRKSTKCNGRRLETLSVLADSTSPYCVHEYSPLSLGG